MHEASIAISLIETVSDLCRQEGDSSIELRQEYFQMLFFLRLMQQRRAQLPVRLNCTLNIFLLVVFVVTAVHNLILKNAIFMPALHVNPEI